MERAKQLYETVLQTRLQRLNTPGLEMWAFPMAENQPGASGALVQVADAPSGGNSTMVHFRCEDCAIEGNRVVAVGGRIRTDKMSIGEYGFIVLAFDTEGNLFGLRSMA